MAISASWPPTLIDDHKCSSASTDFEVFWTTLVGQSPSRPVLRQKSPHPFASHGCKQFGAVSSERQVPYWPRGLDDLGRAAFILHVDNHDSAKPGPDVDLATRAYGQWASILR